MKELIEMLTRLSHEGFFGEVVVVYQAGAINLVRINKIVKPNELKGAGVSQHGSHN